MTVGVDLGGTKLLLTYGARVERLATGPVFTATALEAALRAFVGSLPERPEALGLAVPGLVDSSGSIVACDVLPELVGWSAPQTLQDLACPVMVTNDLTAALAEEFADAEPGLTAGIVLAGTAVGAAFLVEGMPLRGAKGWAGELGYLPLVWDGTVQRLDLLAGGAALAARCGISSAELAARAEEPEIQAVIREGGRALGLALAAVINLLNPARLAMGGGTLLLPGYEAAARQTAQAHSLPELWDACTLKRVQAGELVVAHGAARMALGVGRKCVQ